MYTENNFIKRIFGVAKKLRVPINHNLDQNKELYPEIRDELPHVY